MPRFLGFIFADKQKAVMRFGGEIKTERQTTIPKHGAKVIKRRTLKAILEDFQISAEEFIKLKN